MTRTALLSIGCSLLASACVFGGTKNNALGFGVGEDSTTPDTNQPDMSTASDMSGVDTALPPDIGPADLGPDDVAMPQDMGRPDLPPDMRPPMRAVSAVCVPGTSSDATGQRQYRLRLNTSESFLSAGAVYPTTGADLLGTFWSQWDTLPGFWVSMNLAGTNAIGAELATPEGTGIASVPWFGIPGAVITRRNATNCLYAEYDGFAGSLACANAWGAEAANTGGTTPIYFWFGENGTINAMPSDDLDAMGQHVSATWCAQDPADPTSCLPLKYGTTEARANRGPFVLLSDSVGRAYVWNTVQNIDGSGNILDCVTPPTAPVLITIQGTPVMFADADLVRVGTQDVLVHQTAQFVRLHPLAADLQPMPSTDELPNSGLRPHFDASSDGTRVAAAAAVGSDARIFAFGAGGGVLDVTIDDDATFNARAVAVAVNGDRVAVVSGPALAGTRTVAAGYVGWQ